MTDIRKDSVDLLTALVNERPQLTVHLLVWDYSVLYALEREPFPTLSLGWRTPRRSSPIICQWSPTST
jgi:hypothetical protein